MAEAIVDDDELYRQMRSTPGGVMLIVRLGADLQAMSNDQLIRMRTADLNPNIEDLVGSESRFAETYRWLSRRFGQANAGRALIEEAAAVLKRRSAATTAG